MTTKEFFEMNVGDEFEICFGEYCGKYKVNAVHIDPSHRKDIVYVSKGCYGYNITNDSNYFNWLFISSAQKLSKKTPVEKIQEKIQEKIDELKLELSKWEAEKKSLEIQVGHFYEIEFRSYVDNKNSKMVVYTFDKTTCKIGIIYCQSCKNFLDLDRIISFKRISDISVIEEAWKNV